MYSYVGIYVYMHTHVYADMLILMHIIRTSTGILKLGMQKVLWKAGRCAGSFFFCRGEKGVKGLMV